MTALMELRPVESQASPTSTPARAVGRGSVAVIDALAPEWRALCAEGTHNQPFYRPEWIAAYLRAFEPNASVLLIKVRQGGRLRAVLPLIEERLGQFGLGATRLRAPVNEHSNRFDLIHGVGDGDLAKASIWRTLTDLPGWHALDIRDVPEDGALFSLIESAWRDGFPTSARKTLSSPYFALEAPTDLDSVLDPLEANFRRKVRSGRKKLDAMGPVRIRMLDHADPDTIARFIVVEHAGWKGRSGSAIPYRAETRRFHNELADAASPHGYLSLYELTCGDRPVAINLGFTLDNRFFVPKVANHEAFKAVGPGHVMVAEISRQLFGQNVVEFDMLGHDEPYKKRWTPKYRQHYHCHVFGNGAVGGALQTWTERVMPAGRRVHRTIRRLTSQQRNRPAASQAFTLEHNP